MITSLSSDSQRQPATASDSQRQPATASDSQRQPATASDSHTNIEYSVMYEPTITEL
jgi:hypothetical protein